MSTKTNATSDLVTNAIGRRENQRACSLRSRDALGHLP